MSDKIQWMHSPEDHDYAAAISYLSLIYPKTRIEYIIQELKSSSIVYFKAKDIFRASSLSLLGVSNSHVKKNLNKIEEGTKLSPILLVRDTDHGKVIIADGYHRMCGVYAFDEDAMIPCKIA